MEPEKTHNAQSVGRTTLTEPSPHSAYVDPTEDIDYSIWSPRSVITPFGLYTVYVPIEELRESDFELKQQLQAIEHLVPKEILTHARSIVGLVRHHGFKAKISTIVPVLEWPLCEFTCTLDVDGITTHHRNLPEKKFPLTTPSHVVASEIVNFLQSEIAKVFSLFNINSHDLDAGFTRCFKN
jgi:hypothetical protein